MTRSSKRAAMAVAALGLFFAGATAVPAAAASPTYQADICNVGSHSYTVHIGGVNQNGNFVDTPNFTLGANTCRFYANWWWRQWPVGYYDDGGRWIGNACSGPVFIGGPNPDVWYCQIP